MDEESKWEGGRGGIVEELGLGEADPIRNTQHLHTCRCGSPFPTHTQVVPHPPHLQVASAPPLLRPHRVRLALGGVDL